MFNQTLTSAIQTMSPLWSEQIVKSLALDVRYVTALNMLFNGVSTAFRLEDLTALYIILFLLTMVSSYYINAYTGGIFMQLLGKISIKIASHKRNVAFERSVKPPLSGVHYNNIIERFLHQHQSYIIDPNWIFYDGEENNRAGFGNWDLRHNVAFLQEGRYEVIMPELRFTLTVSGHSLTDTYNRKYTMLFHEGTELLLTETINKVDKLYYANYNTINEKYNLCYLYCEENVHYVRYTITTSQYDPSVFTGYYHPKLDFIKNWIDSLRIPSLHRQPRQVSMILYGESGSGKSSLTRRLAEYTHRTVTVVDLLNIKKKSDLNKLFMSGLWPKAGQICHPTNTIYELDEFDKTIGILKMLKERNQIKENRLISELKSFITMQNTESAPAPVPVSTGDKTISPGIAPGIAISTNESTNEYANEYTSIEWDLDDLLMIFSGSCVPDGRIIIATANDRKIIDEICPFLLRSGRMTPIEYKHGDRDLFVTIVKDYCGTIIDVNDIPEGYSFSQSSLIEYLTVNRTETTPILSLLEQFSVKREEKWVAM